METIACSRTGCTAHSSLPFTDDEEIDFHAFETQVVRLAKAGMGIVLLGTNGEGEP